MKNISFALFSFALLFACTTEDNNVNKTVPLTAIALDCSKLIVEKGDSKILNVIFTPPDVVNKAISWSSNNSEIATISDGVVVGVSAGNTKVTARCGNLLAECDVSVIVSATSITLDCTEAILAPGKTMTITATVLPKDTTDDVEWSSSDEEIATVKGGVVVAIAYGNATITAQSGSQTADCIVTVYQMKAVDLGLSVKWAECNLGAISPEENGDYYAWGEIETKSQFYESNYKFGNGSEGFTKYNTNIVYGTVDNKTVLDPEDDAAHMLLNGNWRMPTREEFNELITQCAWKLNESIKGYTVTGTNGNSIFLPAAGYKNELYSMPSGVYGFYWSSTLYSFAYTQDIPDEGSILWFNDASSISHDAMPRHCGMSIRPVTE